LPEIPGRAAVVLAVVNAGLLFLVLPWLLSGLYPRYGWGAGPVAWNIAGTVPLLVGFGLVASALREHLRRLDGSKRLNPTPQYLIITGPYRFTRNPMYLASALIWLGWTMLFGSLLLLAGLLAILGLTSILGIPFEERQMEARFGDAYLRYKKAVPRWLRMRRRKRV